MSEEPVDVVLIGGGIMSATLGTLLQRLQPDWSIRIYEGLGQVAEESSNPWNNAGTGHAALCELNYTPEAADGSISPDKAIVINEQFQLSRQFWASLVDAGELPEPTTFINPTPHMTFVRGKKNVDYLRRRYDALKPQPLFSDLEYSEDPAVIATWAPLLTTARSPRQHIAATRSVAGTDVNFGSLTRSLFDNLTAGGADLYLNHKITSVKRRRGGGWRVRGRHDVGQTPFEVDARFVFVGAGGGALHLLQGSGIPEISGFGGFPISGQWLRTFDETLVAQHDAKVYGKAAIGAPPMSVPHLDTRIVDGRAALLFGPYAGFSPRFLKTGSLLDLFRSIRPGNIGPMLAVARDNVGLIRYLIGELLAGRSKKVAALRQFLPSTDGTGWELVVAGQRVQVMKKDAKRGGVLQFGTEVIASADGSIAGLLGASPGASTAVPIMVDVLQRCFPDHWSAWEPVVRELIPTLGTRLNDDPELAASTMAATAATLKLVD